MSKRVLITGACGLIGRALHPRLHAAGYHVRGLDPRAVDAEHCGDVRDPAAVHAALQGCHGVLHLGAISRVVWGQRDPALCHATNVDGTRNVLAAAAASPLRPWVVVASSREVYGQADSLPATEDSPHRPMNVYARSKCGAEQLAASARREGVRAAVVRFSNVYGCVRDHQDRVVPAFARAAARGQPLRVEGADRLYDLTHIDDVAPGVMALLALLESPGEATPPPIHFVSGRGTTLGQLAALAVDLAGSQSPLTEAPSRDYDVARFVGDPTRAADLLGWRAETSLRDGLARLIADVRAEVAS